MNIDVEMHEREGRDAMRRNEWSRAARQLAHALVGAVYDKPDVVDRICAHVKVTSWSFLALRELQSSFETLMRGHHHSDDSARVHQEHVETVIRGELTRLIHQERRPVLEAALTHPRFRLALDEREETGYLETCTTEVFLSCWEHWEALEKGATLVLFEPIERTVVWPPRGARHIHLLVLLDMLITFGGSKERKRYWARLQHDVVEHFEGRSSRPPLYQRIQDSKKRWPSGNTSEPYLSMLRYLELVAKGDFSLLPACVEGGIYDDKALEEQIKTCTIKRFGQQLAGIVVSHSKVHGDLTLRSHSKLKDLKGFAKLRYVESLTLEALSVSNLKGSDEPLHQSAILQHHFQRLWSDPDPAAPWPLLRQICLEGNLDDLRFRQDEKCGAWDEFVDLLSVTAGSKQCFETWESVELIAPLKATLNWSCETAVLWLCDCVSEHLNIYEAALPGDDILERLIEAARSHAQGRTKSRQRRVLPRLKESVWQKHSMIADAVNTAETYAQHRALSGALDLLMAVQKAVEGSIFTLHYLDEALLSKYRDVDDAEREIDYDDFETRYYQLLPQRERFTQLLLEHLTSPPTQRKQK